MKAFTKTELLSRGWSPKQIARLAPEPKYKGGKPVWDKREILALEKTAAWQKGRQINKLRISKGTQVRELYADDIIQQVKDLPIDIPRLDNWKQWAMELQDDLQKFQNFKNGTTHELEVFDAPHETVCRWAVNWLRHYYTDYDEQCSVWKALPQQSLRRSLYKIRINNAIAEQYPELQKTCAAQNALAEKILAKCGYDIKEVLA